MAKTRTNIPKYSMKTGVTIGIIGYNDVENFSLCLDALKNLNINNLAVEFIYVDDHSTDASAEKFQRCLLPGPKRLIQNEQKEGRSYNRNKILQSAQFDWILFLNSNIVIQTNSFLLHLINDLHKLKNPIAVMSKLTYACEESPFEKYLNNKYRGINKYQHLQNINFNHLLFSGCLINRAFFIKHRLFFPEKFQGYGGEELVVACQLNSIQKNSIFVNQRAVCTRINHPDLYSHYLKLFNFGNTNFLLLHKNLQKQIVKKESLLLSTRLNVLAAKIGGMILLTIYKFLIFCFPGFLSRFTIKTIYLLAILNGLYANQKTK